ncbi:MAG: TetR family transcriptional regulator [Microbacterium sp.]|nr:MAG: TetR family transcriptional regulator [Microbacterium sp.]
MTPTAPDAAAPDAGRPRGSYAKGVARRQAILDRAIEVFAQRGGRRTSLRAIAQEVGVTHAALTHYFGSLDELLVAVYRASEAPPDGEPATEHDGDATPAEMMRRSAEANRAVPGLVQLYSTLVASALDDADSAAYAFATDRFARLRGQLAERVQAQQDAGLLRADLEPHLVAALVIAASDGLQTQWLLEPSVDHAAALALLDRLLAPPAS